MNPSTTQNKVGSIAFRVLAIVFWFALWEIAARIIDTRFIFPAFSDVIVSLARGFIDSTFWTTILMSILRIVTGFLIGGIIAVITALFSLYKPIYYLVQPLVTITRSTPVASFIMIFWLLVGEPVIPSLIALLMVFPVVWESAYTAAANPPKELLEVADVFRFSQRRRLLYVTMPTMLKATLPSVITASGLAWKAGVAAEIITYTKYSIGRNISEAKNALEGADMFAWTAVVVLLSLAVEWIIKRYTRRVARIWEY